MLGVPSSAVSVGKHSESFLRTLYHNSFEILELISVFVCEGEPVQCAAWAGQCALYILIMMFEKVVIILVLLIPQWKKVSAVGHTVGLLC